MDFLLSNIWRFWFFSKFYAFLVFLGPTHFWVWGPSCFCFICGFPVLIPCRHSLNWVCLCGLRTTLHAWGVIVCCACAPLVSGTSFNLLENLGNYYHKKNLYVPICDFIKLEFWWNYFANYFSFLVVWINIGIGLLIDFVFS